MPSGAGRHSFRPIISLKFPPDPGKKRARLPVTGAGHIPGDDLLSQDLSSHYHWRCSVSLPGSEWDRVVPPRCGHQRAILLAGTNANLDQDWGSGGLSLDRLPADFSPACNRFIEPPLSDIHTEKTSFSFMTDSLGASYELLFLAISLLAMTSKESSRTDD